MQGWANINRKYKVNEEECNPKEIAAKAGKHILLRVANNEIKDSLNVMALTYTK